MAVSMWDTPGFKTFRNSVKLRCSKAHAAIIVYDITRQDSLGNAREWLDILRSESSSNILKALVGNKADLVSERTVSYKVICVCSHRLMSGIKSRVILSNPILSHHWHRGSVIYGALFVNLSLILLFFGHFSIDLSDGLFMIIHYLLSSVTKECFTLIGYLLKPIMYKISATYVHWLCHKTIYSFTCVCY